MDCIAELNAFLNDIDCLESVAAMINRVNVFKVLGIAGTEIRHSFMLAWLLNPHENHGLGDGVLRGLMMRLGCIADLDYYSFAVYRELNNIDLLAVSEKEKTLLCIENKIRSGEHDNQLERYKQHLEGSYPGYHMVLVYLSPAGKESSDPEHWVSLSYDDVMRVIRAETVNAELQPETELLIGNYMDIISSRFKGEGTEIRQACQNVYSRHRKALDRIFECCQKDIQDNASEEERLCEQIYLAHRTVLDRINRNRPAKETGDRIARIIRGWAADKDREGMIRFTPVHSSDRTIRYTTETMSRYLPDVPGRLSDWKTENFYFYEIRNMPIKITSNHALSIQLVVNVKNIPEELLMAADRINEALPADRYGKDYRIMCSTRQVLFDKEAEAGAIAGQMDLFLKEMETYEQKVEQYMEKAVR